jgi:hypothetical protein
MASVAGPRPPGGVHPSGCVVRVRRSSRPVSGRLGVQCIRCPPVRCPAVRCPPVRCPPVRRPAGCCPPPSVRTRPSRLPSGGGGGEQVEAAATVTTERVEARWAAASWSGWMDGRAGPDAGDAAEVALVSGGRWRTRARWGDGGRPRLTGWATRQARPACRAPSLVAAGRAGEQAAARGAAAARVAAVLGLGGDHGGWWSWGLPPGWAGPEGPMGVPAGMGVRPQRGPGSQRALPARCRQRCDLREWLVGLPGLEPGTSS